MINRVWGLKQLWLQVNGHAWFGTFSILLHLKRLNWPVREGNKRKIQNENRRLRQVSNQQPFDF